MVSEIVEFQQWLRRRSPHASTHIHYTNDLKLFFAWLGQPPGAVTPRDIDRFIEHSQQRGHAISTVNRRLYALRVFYDFLSVMGETDAGNPVRPRRHYIRQGQYLPRDVEDDDLERLFAVIVAPRDRAIFLLMLRSGLRVSEVSKLTLADLFLDEQPPRLRLQGKNGKERAAYLSATTIEALNYYLAQRPRSVNAAVFLTYAGQAIGVRGIQKRLRHYCQVAGVTLTAHQLRHNFANSLVLADVPVTSIQKLLGHVWVGTTQNYIAANDVKVKADFNKAAAWLEAWQ